MRRRIRPYDQADLEVSIFLYVAIIQLTKHKSGRSAPFVTLVLQVLYAGMYTKIATGLFWWTRNRI